jgi:hypothetical protein
MKALFVAFSTALLLLHTGIAGAVTSAGQALFTLPFHLFNGHMLIDGSVNGVGGKFLFDTATEFPFFLNNHFLALSKDQRVGSGATGSGQEMVLYRQDAPLQTVGLAGQVLLENVQAPMHTDWGFLEQAYGIARFLGSVGHGFNRDYLFVIDYGAQTIVFHAPGEASQGPVDPARVLAALAFTPTGVDGKIPEVQLRVGGQAITAYFDTGNQGTLELTPATRDALVKRGDLHLVSGAYLYGMQQPHTRAELLNVRYGKRALQGADHLLFKTGQQNRIGLGFQFLKHYVSVWDYQHSVLTLRKP